MKINASDILNAQKFKKEMSVEDFSKTEEFKTLEKIGLMSIEPNKAYKKAVLCLKTKIK
jgi:hypothetical protein